MYDESKGKRKLRYDRIILVAAALLFMVYAAVQLLGKDHETEDVIEPVKEFTPVIYLSPSNQINNAYAAGNTNEAGIMQRIGKRAKSLLEEKGVTVYISDVETPLQDKIDFSNDNEITAYVAIHSNTGSDTIAKEGAICFYDPNKYGSHELAKYIYNKVSALTPNEDRGVMNGAEGSDYLYEVAEVKAPDCLVEVEFHNEIGNANWIIENTDELGQAVADGIMDYISFAEAVYYRQYGESGETQSNE
ncbi:MAG: N-acetylmuramoyl-L-alanine amidase [Clostridium sp.]|nr:N-acetylmuramoyl-L-alanine amidase [Clostridium sp.]MCM1547193.1 N-acetylmuramoyl-L-alanine amidase [Ruminococcus sp.]